MKYFLKAITTNNRDLKTGIVFQLDEMAYLFNVPDGFQRVALATKLQFKRVRYVFLSQTHPDYFGGFPGFYLSTRESLGINLQNFKLSVYVPEGLRQALYAATPFIGSLNFIDFEEYHSPRQIQENDSVKAQVFPTTPGNIMFKDQYMSVQTVCFQSHD